MYFFYKQKTAYEMRISDWSSDVCSSDLMAQVVVTGLVLTALIHLTLGFSPAASLALGLPLALSSTAQVLPGLKSSGRINSPFGEKAFSILLFQDLAIVPMITIVAVLSRAPADPSAPPGWQMAFFTDRKSTRLNSGH